MNGIGDNDPDLTIKIQRKRKLSPKQICQMVIRYKAGESLTDLAAAFDVSVSGVYYQLNQRVVMRPAGEQGIKKRFWLTDKGEAAVAQIRAAS